MATTSVDVRRYAPRFTIEMDGRRLENEFAGVVTSVSVEQELNRTNAFRFVVEDELMPGRFRWLGHELFRHGNRAKITMGYLDQLVTLAVGRVQAIQANFSQALAPSFTVEGADDAYVGITAAVDSETFPERTDADIARRLAERFKLSAMVDDTPVRADQKTKRGGLSYLKFLTDLAHDNGFEFQLSGRTLIFANPRRTEAEVTALIWGQHLLSFQPRLNTGQLLSEVVVRSWDRSGKRLIEERVRAGEETRQEPGKRPGSELARQLYGEVTKVITDRQVRSPAEARCIARAELERASDGLIEATGEIMGEPNLAPGMCVRVEGVGAWFTGKYRLTRVAHRIGAEGYRSQITARRNAL